MDQLWKDISLQAPWSLRNVLENPTIEDIDSRVHEPGGIAITLFLKTTHSTLGSYLDRPVPHFILHSKHRHTCYSARFAMKLDELPEVNFHERVAVHHQEVGRLTEERCGEFYGA